MAFVLKVATMSPLPFKSFTSKIIPLKSCNGKPTSFQNFNSKIIPFKSCDSGDSSSKVATVKNLLMF
jgi:hypothetical protein